MATLGSLSDFLTDPDVDTQVALAEARRRDNAQRLIAAAGGGLQQQPPAQQQDQQPRMGSLATDAGTSGRQSPAPAGGLLSGIGSLAGPPAPLSPPDATGWQPGQAQRDEPRVQLQVPAVPQMSLWERIGAALEGQGTVRDQLARARTMQSLAALSDFQPKFDKASREGNSQTAQNLLAQFMPYAIQSPVGLQSYQKAVEFLTNRQLEQQQKQADIGVVRQSGVIKDPVTLALLTAHAQSPVTTREQMMQDIKQYQPDAAIQMGQLLNYNRYRPGELQSTALPAVSEVGQMTDTMKQAVDYAFQGKVTSADVVNAQNRARTGDPIAQLALERINQQLGPTVQTLVQNKQLSPAEALRLGINPGTAQAQQATGLPPAGGQQPQAPPATQQEQPTETQAPSTQQLPLAQRMNNPLNVKVGPATQKWVDQGVAVPGAQAQDGGRFLQFQTSAQGYAAAQDLLTGPNYQNLSVDAALRKWSNNGYGAEIVPGVAASAKVSQLTPAELQTTLGAMAQREGGQTPSQQAAGGVLPQPPGQAMRQAEGLPAPPQPPHGGMLTPVEQTRYAEAQTQYLRDVAQYQAQRDAKAREAGSYGFRFNEQTGDVDMAPPGLSDVQLREQGYTPLQAATKEAQDAQLYRQFRSVAQDFRAWIAERGMPGDDSAWQTFRRVATDLMSGVPIAGAQLAGAAARYAVPDQMYMNTMLTGLAQMAETMLNRGDKPNVEMERNKAALTSAWKDPQTLSETLNSIERTGMAKMRGMLRQGDQPIPGMPAPAPTMPPAEPGVVNLGERSGIGQVQTAPGSAPTAAPQQPPAGMPGRPLAGGLPPGQGFLREVGHDIGVLGQQAVRGVGRLLGQDVGQRGDWR